MYYISLYILIYKSSINLVNISYYWSIYLSILFTYSLKICKALISLKCTSQCVLLKICLSKDTPLQYAGQREYLRSPAVSAHTSAHARTTYIFL